MKQFSSVAARIRNAKGEFVPIPALRGATSYEVAVQNGFKGSQDEWLSMMFEDGWVAKFQELDAKKADKSDTYTKAETKELLTDYKKKIDHIVSYSDFVSMGEYLYSEKMMNGYATISPNREYLAFVGGNSLKVYRSKDGLNIASYTLDFTAYAVVMDDDFIIVSGTNTDYACFSLKSGPKSFVGVDKPAAPILRPASVSFLSNNGTSGTDNIWFWTRPSSASSSNATNTLYKLNKNDMTLTAMKTLSSGSDITCKWYPDGEDVIIAYFTYTSWYKPDSTANTMTGVNVYVEKISSDGVTTPIMTIGPFNSDGINYPCVDFCSYDPKSGFLVIGGRHVVNNSTDLALTQVYGPDGILSHSATIGLCTRSIDDIVDGCLYTYVTSGRGDNYPHLEPIDLNTLERLKMSPIYVNDSTTPLPNISSSTSYGSPGPIAGNVYYGAVGNGYASYMYLNTHKIQTGGWIVNE